MGTARGKTSPGKYEINKGMSWFIDYKRSQRVGMDVSARY